MQQVLHHLNSDAVYGAQGEGAQQCGQVGDVQLDKGRHQRNGEFDELQHGGHSRQHGSHGKAMGFLMLCHKKRLPFDDVTPLEAIVSQGARIKKEHYENAVHAFSHPDCNCRYRNCTGSCSPRKGSLADYTAGGELRPAPKTNDPVVFIRHDTALCGKKQALFHLGEKNIRL